MVEGILLADHTRYSLPATESAFSGYLHGHLKLSSDSGVKFGSETHYSVVYFTTERFYIVRSMLHNAPQFQAEVVKVTTFKSLLEYLSGFHGAKFTSKVKQEFMSNAYPRL